MTRKGSVGHQRQGRLARRGVNPGGGLAATHVGEVCRLQSLGEGRSLPGEQNMEKDREKDLLMKSESFGVTAMPGWGRLS